jgi:hypothetical protein
MRARRPRLLLGPLLAATIAACGDAEQPSPAAAPPSEQQPSPGEPGAAPSSPAESASELADEPTPTDEPVPTDEPTPERAADEGSVRPDWLGTRVLPARDDGLGEVRPTPPELVDRRLPPPDGPGLPPPPEDGGFAATVGPVPAAVAERSTWREACPVGLEELRYLTVTFWGFDDRAHTGELIVHRRVAEDVTGVFERLFRARFPIEELRVIRAGEPEAPPTGDGNTSTGFVCRETTLGASWSQHAYGLAVDINPFHNPYTRGDAVVPELATAYLDRDRHRPGMIRRGDVVTGAFADIGWGWGGHWQSAKDWMHFSESGR